MADLFLIEISAPDGGEATAVEATFNQIESAAKSANGELIEVQYGRDLGVIYAIVEHRSQVALGALLKQSGLDFPEVVPVRLVGPTLEEVKARSGKANYLVEWDIPAEISMDMYLAAKKKKGPLYAKVPETKFLRTYVREDTIKCLCLYDAPDEEAVRRARAAVATPIDRLTRIA